MASKRCSGCGAEWSLGPGRCPLCGADEKERPAPSETDPERYRANVRKLREQLKKLREDNAEAV